MVHIEIHTCLSKTNRHFIIYIVAKKISLHKSFGSPWPSKQTIVIYLNVSNVYNNHVSVSHLHVLSVW